MINQEDPTFKAHFNDQFEAAAAETWEVTTLMNSILTNDEGRKVKTTATLNELIGGYLLEKWTWFTNLEDVKNGKMPHTPPEICSHIDPLHPAAWYGLLNYPNKFWCLDCATQRVFLDAEHDAHVCDRCLNDNVHKFYDFGIPLGNIQLIGSVCGMCVEKTKEKA